MLAQIAVSDGGDPLKYQFIKSDFGGPTSLRDNARDAADALKQLIDSVGYIRDELVTHGSESPVLATLLQFAGRDLLSLGAHLKKSGDQAKVFTVLGSCAEGAAMQQALDVLDEITAEMEAAGAFEEELALKEFDPEQLAVDRIALEHNVTITRAGIILANALAVHRCTRVWNVLMNGEMSAAVALRIANELEHVVDPDKLLQIQDVILGACLKNGKCVRWSSWMTRKLHRVINAIDPDAVKRDDKDSAQKREVRMWPASPSSSTIAATLPVLEAEAVWSSIDNLAVSWGKIESETRTLAERRADALIQMVTGTDKRPEGDCTPIGHQVCTPSVTLVADMPAGASRERAFAAKGSTTRQKLDELLEQAKSAKLATVPLRADEVETELPRFVKLVEAVVARLTEQVTYTPSAALRRLVVARDGTCRFPGCQVPASKCDLDHVVPFNHNDPLGGGLTREANLIALCRHHHREKTHNGSTYRLLPDGTVWVVLADGTEGTSSPGGHRGFGRSDLGLSYAELPERYRELVEELEASASALSALCATIAKVKSPDYVVEPDDAPTEAKSKRTQTRAERRAEATKRYRRRPPVPKPKSARERRQEVIPPKYPSLYDGTTPLKPWPKRELPEDPPF